jgi:hypothetical protein
VSDENAGALSDGEREEILSFLAALARKLDPDPAAQVSNEIASLRETVDALRQQLAAQGHGCCHHHVCWHYPYYGSTVGTTTAIHPQTYTISTGTTYQGGGTVTYGNGGAIT